MVGTTARVGGSTLILAVLSSFVLPASARDYHALLVGVSEYPNLAPEYQLCTPPERKECGPRQDVFLARKVLLQNHFLPENIRILADGVQDAGEPTYQRIRDELGVLSGRVKDGDFVYIHFSGHGSQQPANPKAEGEAEYDGLDEIFLARDVTGWNGEVGKVEHALVDDEISQVVGAIRAKGAFMWLVFDSCHSGTMTRGGPAVQLRMVEPSVLKIPAWALQEASAIRTRGGPSGTDSGPLSFSAASGQRLGSFVAFFAAQSTELAPQMLLPKSDPSHEPHGLLTFSLFRVLNRYPGISYRQAIQQVIQEYAAYPWHGATPLYEGTALDAPVFGNAEAGGLIQQWPLKKGSDALRVEAGSLAYLSKGSILAVVPGPAASDKDILGYVEVTEVDLMQGTVKPLKHLGKAPLMEGKIPDGAYARLAQANLSFTVRVAQPPSAELNSKQGQLVRDVLKDLQSGKIGTFKIEWVPEAEADIRLAVADDKEKRLWLLPPSGDLIERGQQLTPSLPIPASAEELRASLVDALQRIAKVMNLLRLAQQLNSAQQSFKLSVSAQGKPLQAATQNTGGVLTLYGGDPLEFRLRNTSKIPLDITALFVGSDYSITPIFPLGGQVNRVESGAEAVVKGKVNEKSFGQERVIVIAVEMQPQAPVEDFSYLAQAGVTTRKGKGPGVARLLEAAGFLEGERGFEAESTATMKQVSMETVTWVTSKR